MDESIRFASGTTRFVPEFRLQHLADMLAGRKYVVITDNQVQRLYNDFPENVSVLSIPTGEGSKSLETIRFLTEELLRLGADRSTVLVGFGGGVVTDITGFVAAIYKRGVPFGFIPSTLLAMVDASIGGKNGINSGAFKNVLGTIRQPEFLFLDTSLLSTLPREEWANGFAEIIKYACISDAALYSLLSDGNLQELQNDVERTKMLIQRCCNLKIQVVVEDEQERSRRKLLNFGHTVGHAIENLYNLSHGQAISIGMMVAARLSEQLTGLPSQVTASLQRLLRQYELPTSYLFNPDEVMRTLSADKKRRGDLIDFILLERVGKAVIRPVALDDIHRILELYLHEGNH